MTTKLNYDDIVSCCNSCSEPEVTSEPTTSSETTVQSISNDFNLYATVGTTTATTAMNTPENVFIHCCPSYFYCCPSYFYC